MSLIIVAAISEDKVGIVKRLSHIAAENGDNIEWSFNKGVGGLFFSYLLISVKDDHKSQKIDDYNRLNDSGEFLSIHARDAVMDAAYLPKNDVNLVSWTIYIEGIDTPGIIDQLTGHLVQNEINITELSFEKTNAPFSGTEMFMLSLHALTDQKIERDDIIKILKPLNTREYIKNLEVHIDI